MLVYFMFLLQWGFNAQFLITILFQIFFLFFGYNLRKWEKTFVFINYMCERDYCDKDIKVSQVRAI